MQFGGILSRVSLFSLATVATLTLASPRGESMPRATSESGTDSAPRLNFDSVYTNYFDFVFRNLSRMGVERNSLDDAAHDVFLVVYRQLENFDGRHPKGWLFAITQRVAWHYRRSHARRRTDPIAEESLVDESDPSPEATRERQEASDLVQLLLNQLSDDRRAVFVLSELEQLSMPEIAKMLQIPLNTAYSRLRLARRDFSRHLTRHESKLTRAVL